MASVPPELRLQVFKHCPDISTSINLAKSCKKYNETWSYFTESICEAILPRMVPHYDQALALIHLQLKSSTPLPVQRRLRLIVSNQKQVEKSIATAKQDEYWFPHPYLPPLTGSELSRFSLAYYCLWLLAIVLEKCDEPLLDISVEDLEETYFTEISNHDLYIISEVGISWVFSRLGDQLHTSRESPDVKLWGDRLSIAGGYRKTTSAFPWEAAAWVIQQMAIRRAKAEKSPLRKLGWRYGMGVLLDENQDPLVTTYSGAALKRVLVYGNRNWKRRPG
ncbi:MAG: hypothetical protein Q9205_006933 [Flavoplaca limonia]